MAANIIIFYCPQCATQLELIDDPFPKRQNSPSRPIRFRECKECRMFFQINSKRNTGNVMSIIPLSFNQFKKIKFSFSPKQERDLNQEATLLV